VRLIANLDKNRHGSIIGHIFCSQFSAPRPIRFVVDTGCSTTTLLSDDVTRLAINCKDLKKASTPCSTANGLVVPYVLLDVIVFLEVESGWLNRKKELVAFNLPKVNCMLPTRPKLMTSKRIQHAFSLMGMDFLDFFRKWRFTDSELILEH